MGNKGIGSEKIPSKKGACICSQCIYGHDCIFPSKNGKPQEVACMFLGLAVKVPRTCDNFVPSLGPQPAMLMAAH